MGDPLGSPPVAPLFGAENDSAVKRAWARVVLGWVTPWEVLVLHPFLVPRSYVFGCRRACGLVFLLRVGWSGLRSPLRTVFFVHGAERGESQGQATPVSARRVWERSGSRMDKGIKRGSISGAIIPALMHRIPSELRS
ncbi:hypothetical protein L6452_36066 [Arctium lappa]|uniref:Uncharacterized protein n=1 Tax=Arctium lappa TaxID=4217 RepID=A0ACB8Y8W7_ARCLA|nr:hypothetical protein L6452_36066 [Arctium lappa]